MNELQSHKFSVLIFFSILLCEKTVNSIESRAITSSQCTGDQLHTHYCDEIVKIKVMLNARLDAIDSNVNFFHQELNELIKKDASSQPGCSSAPRTPNLQQCTKTAIFLDSDKNYLKSVCYVQQAISYYDAEKFCLNNQMELMHIENQAVHNEFINFVKESHGLEPNVWDRGRGIWINGRFDGKSWSVIKNFKKHEIGEGIKISREHQHPGDCAAFKRNNNVYEIRDFDCRVTFYFYCEYHSNL